MTLFYRFLVQITFVTVCEIGCFTRPPISLLICQGFFHRVLAGLISPQRAVTLDEKAMMSEEYAAAVPQQLAAAAAASSNAPAAATPRGGGERALFWVLFWLCFPFVLAQSLSLNKASIREIKHS